MRCVLCIMNEVGEIDREEGYLGIDIFSKIEVADIVLINSSIVAALANKGYATTIFETESHFEKVDAGLHLVSFTALRTEV